MSRAAGAWIGESDAYASLASFVRPVVQARAEDTVASAASTLRDQRMGCVVVTSDGRPIGILTDRDLAIRVVADGLNPRTTLIGEVLTHAPFTLEETDTIDTAVKCMMEHGVRRLPILGEDGTLVGIVTADDLIVGLGRQLAAVSQAIAEPSDAADSR